MMVKLPKTQDYFRFGQYDCDSWGNQCDFDHYICSCHHMYHFEMWDSVTDGVATIK